MSTVNLGCKLDLKTIALKARNAEYNPKVRLPSSVMVAHASHSPQRERWHCRTR